MRISDCSSDVCSSDLIDFELILFYAHQLILTVPSIKKLLGSLFACILVDELQDTKEIQYAILGTILKAANGRATAFLVGDPNQAIYGSLGGYAITCAAFGQLRSEERRVGKECV